MVGAIHNSSTKGFQWFYFCQNLTLMTLAPVEEACQIHISETEEYKTYQVFAMLVSYNFKVTIKQRNTQHYKNLNSHTWLLSITVYLQLFSNKKKKNRNSCIFCIYLHASLFYLHLGRPMMLLPRVLFLCFSHLVFRNG